MIHVTLASWCPPIQDDILATVPVYQFLLLILVSDSFNINACQLMSFVMAVRLDVVESRRKIKIHFNQKISFFRKIKVLILFRRFATFDETNGSALPRKISRLGSATFCRMAVLKIGSNPGNTKGGSVTVQLTSCLTGLESAV
jgi:hypothetical protein